MSATFPYSCVFDVGEGGQLCMVTEYVCFEGAALYKSLALKCLARCPSESGRYTFGAEGYTYNFLVDACRGLLYGVVAAESQSRTQCFEFLKQVQRELRVSCVAAVRAHAFTRSSWDHPHAGLQFVRFAAMR